MRILVTGSAGFVGNELTLKLLRENYQIFGIDNQNNYYDPILKKNRLKKIKSFKNYKHFKLDLINYSKIYNVCKKYKIKKIIHLAAQAGLRYSLVNPHSYIKNNIEVFYNILEVCKNLNIKTLIYASSSSVYGLSNKNKFSENDITDSPLNIYAATKKSNELMAHAYSHLFNIKTIGLRFFTVYGPWGRPDMALFKFVKNILNNKKIDLFNNGNHKRSFTYIDDVVNAIIDILRHERQINNISYKNRKNSHIYNIGNYDSVKLVKLINIIEKILNKKAKINYLPLQPGDIKSTAANITKLKKDYKFKAKTNIFVGVKKFVEWYLSYFKIKN
jgi:UDP-glucuronate 4-epimerase